MYSYVWEYHSYYEKNDKDFDKTHFSIDLGKWAKRILEHLQTLKLIIARFVLDYPTVGCLKNYKQHPSKFINQLQLEEPVLAARVYPIRTFKKDPKYVVYVIHDSLKLSDIWYKISNLWYNTIQYWGSISRCHNGTILSHEISMEILTDSRQYQKLLQQFKIF